MNFTPRGDQGSRAVGKREAQLDTVYLIRYIPVMVEPKKLPARFFATTSGSEPVREWLKSLSHGDRRIVGRDICDVEFGWPVGMPLCRSLGRGLFEVRSNIADGRVARVVFFLSRGEMILLHGFVKKARKTPQPDLELAVKRMKEYRRYE